MYLKRRLKVLAIMALAAVLLFPVAALTCTKDPVRIYGAIPVYYTTIQAAYDDAVDDDIIQSHGVTFIEDLALDGNVTVTLDGGYNCDYTAKTGETAITGDMDVTDGDVTVEDYTLQ